LWSSPEVNSITLISEYKGTQEEVFGAILRAPVRIS
jgi:hypothetical protein